MSGRPTVPDGYARAGPLGVVVGGLGPGLGVLFTNPFDVAKVRLQMQRELGKGAIVYRNPVHCLAETARREGLRGVQRGLLFCIARDSSKGLFRLGLNDPILYRWHGPPSVHGPAPFWKAACAGLLSGAASAVICNPFDLVKTRLQACGGLTASHHRVSSGFAGLRAAVRESGWRGLWRGTGINVLRSSSFMASMWPVNAKLKSLMAVYDLPDGICRDFVSSFGGSAVGILFLNPCDVVRTRLYNQPRNADGTGRLYRGIPDCVVKIVTTEGVRGMQKGLVANYMRVGPQTMLSLVFIGRIRAFLVEREQQRLDREYDASAQVEVNGAHA
eukprot:TRINITY_DN39628_c0_g1_i1.p1 TRINITY_DN39628_c0_g1~~TRINITY_DN39628_c0_g1_i1.p1  ORF type:complete len:330 (+),score=95.64 TRINITY_DN39628_c0_g1_i1:55-1044(+)